MRFELLYRIWQASIKAFRQKKIFIPCIAPYFNYGPQSGGERGTGSTKNFLSDGGPLLHKFCLKSLHSSVGREAGLGLQD